MSLLVITILQISDIILILKCVLRLVRAFFHLGRHFLIIFWAPFAQIISDVFSTLISKVSAHYNIIMMSQIKMGHDPGSTAKCIQPKTNLA